MKYKKYNIKATPAGNTDIDHANDICCTVYKQTSNAGQKNVEIGHFTITANEIGDYGSLEAAIIGYMHRDYPDNNPADEERYSKIKKLEKQLQTEQKALLIDILNRNGRHITSYPVPDEDGGVEYPITMAFYDKHDSPGISITDVYLNGAGVPYVDGIDEATGSVKRGFRVYSEQCPWVLGFVTIALSFKDTEV